MMHNILAATVLLSVLSVPFWPAAAQGPGSKGSGEPKCEAPIYISSDVSRRAKVTFMPDLEFTEEFRVTQSKWRAQLTAVLCKTGEVTGVEIIEGLPDGMNKKLVEAVRGVKFTAAQKDGQAVSQRQRFEFIID